MKTFQFIFISIFFLQTVASATAATTASTFSPSVVVLKKSVAPTAAPKNPLAQFKPENWGLSEKGANITSAWKLNQGSRNVVVAVIDTGIDATHPDLIANLWKAPGTNANAGSGSVYGYDFVTKSYNPRDSHGHGTHIAGIIGAIANPKSGTAGVAQNVQIMAVRYYDESAPGKVNLANTIKALHYAIDNGAKIINYSGGGPEFSQEEYDAMKKAQDKGVLIVAAAGNESHNTDSEAYYYYPAAYQQKGLKNIITVASVDSAGKLLPSSNWGATSVDVAAPGEAIWSTTPGARYSKMTGTSQGTAFVSGIAALLLSKQPALTPVQLKSIIMSTVTKPRVGTNFLNGKVASGGRVNAYEALLALDHLKTVTRKTASSQKK